MPKLNEVIKLDAVRGAMLNIYDEERVAKEISFAKQLYDENKYLQKCTPKSLMTAIVNVANLGLTLNPVANEAALIPRRVSGDVYKAQLMPQYIGLVKTLTDAGVVKAVTAQAVYENDKFEVNLADNQTPVIHAPSLGNRGAIIGYYAVATLNDGTRQAEFMDLETIKRIRSHSESYKAYKAKGRQSPWVEWEDEMGRKSAIKRLCKYLPRSGAMMDKVMNMISLDNQDYDINQPKSLAGALGMPEISPVDALESAQADDSDEDGELAEEQENVTEAQEEQPGKLFEE